MKTTFNSSVDVTERLQVVRRLNRAQCETALANAANERLQATIVKALQARLRRLAKVAATQVSTRMKKPRVAGQPGTRQARGDQQ